MGSFVAPTMMEIFEPNHPQIGMWEQSFKTDTNQNPGTSRIGEVDKKFQNKVEDVFPEALRSSDKLEQEANKISNKVLKRLAQNRVAARKCRLRKKAYVQQLESSRIKLAQLEKELEQTRQQGVYVGGVSGSGLLGGMPSSFDPGIAAFEMEYAHWVEDQHRRTCELRAALLQNASDLELRILVDGSMCHYDNLFRLRSTAAKRDVFYLMNGMWRTSVERFFLWIGGFRPSEILKVLIGQLETLTKQQILQVSSLQQSSQQAEDALSQGMDKLQQTLADILTYDLLASSSMENYMVQMATAVNKLEALVNFVIQADHLRQQTLQQMYRILTIRQAAHGLLALDDYFQRFRALSSLWTARPRDISTQFT